MTCIDTLAAIGSIAGLAAVCFVAGVLIGAMFEARFWSRAAGQHPNVIRHGGRRYRVTKEA